MYSTKHNCVVNKKTLLLSGCKITDIKSPGPPSSNKESEPYDSGYVTIETKCSGYFDVQRDQRLMPVKIYALKHTH